MSTRYSGPATLRTETGVFDVQVVLSTNDSDGTYSWGGRLTCSDVAALGSRGRGGTLSIPDGDSEVHVTVADLDPEHGGVLLRVNGHGQAPYETPEDRAAIAQQHAEETA